ncbi:MAG: hypothetical protein IPM60_01825 [Rhodospirillales bacterium]|nr:hypothetical protein [Rhodospirillales bacterium]
MMTILDQDQRVFFDDAFDVAHDWVEVADDLPGYDDEPVGEFRKFARNVDDFLPFD